MLHRNTHTHTTFNTCLCQTSSSLCGFSAAQKEPCLNKFQLVTRVLKNLQQYTEGESALSITSHIRLPRGLRATTLVGFTLLLRLSLSFPTITMGRDVEVQNTQMIRCWTFTALVSYSSAPGSSWVKSKPLLFLYFYFCSVLGRLFLRLEELRLLSGLWWKAIIKLTFTPLLNQRE